MITRHAIARYSERARVIGLPGRLANELINGVRNAIDEGALFRAGEIHVIPVRGRVKRVCLVAKVRGPAEKPYAVVVCTVLTEAMAIETFGHVIGLLEVLRARPLASSAQALPGGVTHGPRAQPVSSSESAACKTA